MVQAPLSKPASASLNSQSVSAVGAVLKHFLASARLPHAPSVFISAGVRSMRTLLP